MYLDHVLLAVRQIRGRWLESAIVALGVALGSGLAVSMLGLVASYLTDKAAAANDPDLRMLHAQSTLNLGWSETAVTRIGTVSTPEIRFPLDILQRARTACPTATQAWMEVDFEFDAETIGGQRDTPARATTPDFFDAYRLVAERGSLFDHTDVDLARQVVVLGQGLSQRLRLEVGDRLPVDDVPYTVLGILAQDEDPDQDLTWGRNNLAYVPATSVPIGQRPDWGVVAFSVGRAADLPRAQAQIERFFESEYGPDVVRVSASAGYLWDLAHRMEGAISLVSILASLSLLISAVNGANIMLVQVVRRTRAMGICRAIGASRRSLFLQVTWEALLLGLSGGVVGAACAVGLQNLMRTVLRAGQLPGADAVGLPPAVLMPACIAVALVMSLLLSVYPALRASLTHSATALRED